MNYLAIAVGAVLGAWSRYAIFNLIGNKTFPYNTLLVNVIGCFAAGLIVEYLAFKSSLSPALKLFFITGFLGSFTTFSAFAIDTGVLSERGELAKAFLYICSSVFLGIAGYFAAVYTMRGILR